MYVSDEIPSPYQVELLGEISLDRSTNVARSIQEEFSFDLLITGMLDNRYPTELRAGFARVLTNLYVDQMLHVDLEPPLEVRVVPDLPRLPKELVGLCAWCCGAAGASSSKTGEIDVTEHGSGGGLAGVGSTPGSYARLSSSDDVEDSAPLPESADYLFPVYEALDHAGGAQNSPPTAQVLHKK